MSIPRRNVDIAIIGMSCRFPGAASAEEYWKNLCDGVESITFFSNQELVAAGVDPSLIANPSYVKAAPMLRDVETFDAAFFGYSPKDAALMRSRAGVMTRQLTPGRLAFSRPPAASLRAICWQSCTMQIFPVRQQAFRTSTTTRTS